MGMTSQLFSAVDARNQQQTLMMDKFRRRYGDDPSGETFARWGIAFKQHTDDVRESPALFVIERLTRAGAVVRAYDPKAVETSRALLGNSVDDCLEYVAGPMQAVDGADALLILTE